MCITCKIINKTWFSKYFPPLFLSFFRKILQEYKLYSPILELCLCIKAVIFLIHFRDFRS